jgi:hypothetical protein
MPRALSTRAAGALACLALSSSIPAAAAACGSKSGGPTDAPTATLYGAGAYAWADTMVPWACVWNVKDYPAATDDAAFAAAQEAAVAGGGGVVFFPAGTYAFTHNLTLSSNVVIRGAPTTAPAKAGKNPGSLAPTTVFTCPNRAHVGVWNIDAGAANLGVVNVLLDQCAVMLWPALKSTNTTEMHEAYWFDATDVLGMGNNKLVLSNVVRDVSLGRASPIDAANKNVLPYVFSTAIAVYTDKNALVANNLLPASTRKVCVCAAGGVLL